MSPVTSPSEPTVDDADGEWLLSEGRRHELAGRMMQAVECYATAIDRTGADGAPRTLAEAQRRLGVLHHLRGQPQAARDLCTRGFELALQTGANDLAAEALNALAGFDFEQGSIALALGRYLHALELAAGSPTLIAKIEHNLGTVASVRGDWIAAGGHYERSLEASELIADQRGCAFAHHNLGRVQADQKRWGEAERSYHACERLAEAAGDEHLRGLASLSLAEVDLGLKRYDRARQYAEGALRAFVQLDARRDRAGAHRILGMIFAETGRPALAESHLGSALEIARAAECPLLVADTLRELAKLSAGAGRRAHALTCLGEARKLYARLDARPDLLEIAKEERQLQPG